MKTVSKLSALLFALSLGVSAPAFAIEKPEQPAGEKRPEGEERREGRKHPGMRILESVLTQLELTEDQTSKTKTILAETRAALKAAFDESAGDKKAMREKSMQIMGETREQITAILTDEQKTKFSQLLAEAKKNEPGKKERKEKKPGKDGKPGREKPQGEKPAGEQAPV